MSGYTPLGQPPGGIAWRSKIFKSFGLVVPPELGTTNAGYSTGQYGLAFTPSFSFTEAGTSIASVTLSVPPSLLQQAPKGQFGLSFAPDFVFAGAEHYTNSVALMVGPIHFQPSGVENYDRSVLLSMSPQFLPTAQVVLNDIALRPMRAPNPMVGPMALRNANRMRRPIPPLRRSAITFDAVGTGTYVQTASSVSWSHTATAGAYALAFITVELGGSTPTLASAPTYDGLAMTLIGSVENNNAATSGRIFVYGRANVPGGTKTVAASFSGSYYGASNSVSYIGVSAAGDLTKSYGSGTSVTNAATCSGNDMVVNGITCFARQITSPTGGTNRYLNSTQNGDLFYRGGLAINDASATTTFGATLGASADWGAIAIRLT